MFKEAGKQLFLEDRVAPLKAAAQDELKKEVLQNALPDEGQSNDVDTASPAMDITPPVIAKLAFDIPGEGLFYSALKV
jgi:hypothetical protein